MRWPPSGVARGERVIAVRFTSRGEAGEQLADRVRMLRVEHPVVVAIPPGGVPVAFEVAQRLDAPLDIVGVHVLGAPLQPAVAIGAVGEEHVRAFNRGLAKRLCVAQPWLDRETRHVTGVLRQQVRRLRNGVPTQPVSGRAVILVDDGIASGLTAHAAVEVLRRRGVARVVLATPVATESALRTLSGRVDDVVCLEQVSSLQAIRRAYCDLRPVSDNKVRRLLAVAAGLQPDITCQIALPDDGGRLMGNLAVPVGATGLVIFVQDRSGGRRSPDHRAIATHLGDAGLGTLLVDLLTDRESAQYTASFDIRLLAGRLVTATRWAAAQPKLGHLPIGYLAVGSGASTALVAAAEANLAGAIVCCGGRPDLAAGWLSRVATPTLFVVGTRDIMLRQENITARRALRGEVGLEFVPGATQPFDQPATLDETADLAASWFVHHLRSLTATG